MRRLAVQIALLGIVVGGAYLAIFQRDFVIGLFQRAKQKAQGYDPATTPEEAMDFFNKTLEERDYKVAADLYLTGDFQGQFRKMAEPAEKLGEALDNFRAAMETANVGHSEEVKLVLDVLEPLPKKLKVVDFPKKESDEALARVQMEGPLRLAPLFGTAIPLKREGDHWKLDIPVTPSLRGYVENLVNKHQDYVNALNVVKNRMKTDATTKENVLRDLQDELGKIK